MEIIQTISGMSERTVVYTHDGVRGSLTRPAIVSFEEMYREIKELLEGKDDGLQETKEYEIVQSENVRMHSDLEAKVAIKSVEEYAEQELGLQQLDQSQIEYIQLQTDDSVEIPDEEKNLFVRIKDKFESFMEYLKG